MIKVYSIFCGIKASLIIFLPFQSTGSVNSYPGSNVGKPLDAFWLKRGRYFELAHLSKNARGGSPGPISEIFQIPQQLT